MKVETGREFFQHSEPTETLILCRIADGDKNAFRECVERYGDMIWSLAKHYSGSEAEAETATLEIFRELRRCAGKFENSGCGEIVFIRLIAYRLLINRQTLN
jgi:DNA-directed RNA polymerase specialized sigma24 family protein